LGCCTLHTVTEAKRSPSGRSTWAHRHKAVPLRVYSRCTALDTRYGVPCTSYVYILTRKAKYESLMTHTVDPTSVVRTRPAARPGRSVRRERDGPGGGVPSPCRVPAASGAVRPPPRAAGPGVWVGNNTRAFSNETELILKYAQVVIQCIAIAYNISHLRRATRYSIARVVERERDRELWACAVHRIRGSVSRASSASACPHQSQIRAWVSSRHARLRSQPVYLSAPSPRLDP
jgi:hypothetical protein